jgi:hypothetical protein
MPSPLVRSLFREFVNWRPRYTKEARLQKCRKCKHSYQDHTIFPTFTNLFLDVNSDSAEEDIGQESNYSFCSLCNCSGFSD